MTRAQPLVAITSIRTRLAVLVGGSVLVAAVVGTAGSDAGVPLWLGLPVTIAVALVVTRWLASGMTTPLLEMTAAADRMARGDYSTRITTTGQDEVATLARAFSTMAQEIEQSEDHRRRLVATVAHELRTPLSAQQALLENLADGVVEPDEARLRTALAQSERLASLVTDLLDLSRPDGRGTALNPSRVRVQDLVQEATSEAALQGRDVRLIADVEPAELTVTGDRARLSQVTANLLDNAIRHSPVGGTVTISARTEHDVWHLTVVDEGPGLSPERAERLFHRFGPGGDEGGGTGLGLAIAAWVAGMHGGTIRALPFETLAAQAPQGAGDPRTTHPAQGAGSAGACIRMTLPLVPPSPTPAPRPLATRGPVPTATQEQPMSVQSRPPTTGAASPPSLSWARWWPERTTQPQPRLLLAALAVGVLAALVVPGNAPGLGLLLVLVCGGVALWVTSPHRATRWSWATAALALPLGATTVLRANPGFIFLAVAVAGVLAAAACTDARRVTGMCAGVLAWPGSALRGLPLLDRTLRALGRRGRLWSVVRTGGVSLVLLLVFGGLLSSADAVLGSWTSALVPDIGDMVIFRVFTLVFFAGVTLAGLYLSLNPPPVDRLDAGAHIRARIPAREWQIPLLVVIAVFVAFIAAQAAAVFGGHDYVMATTGVTYAESARQGFGQLTLVTALVLLLVAGVRAWGRADTDRDRRAMRIGNAVLCLLTLLVVASALRRMALYQDAFGYTVLRVSVDLFEIWLGLVVLAVLISLFTPDRRWLGRTVLVSAALVTILWSVGNTSAWVAERNIDRFTATGQLDASYLSSLPADAVPTIHASSLPEHVKACIITGTDTPFADEDAGLASWNLARDRAAGIRDGYTRPNLCEADLGSVR